MSIEENVQIVKDFFAAMGSYNEQGLLAMAAEDIEWIIPGEGWPLAGTYRGHTELAAVLKKASKEVETEIPTAPFEFVAQGDRVLVVGVATGRIKATNKPYQRRLGLRHYRSKWQTDEHPGVYRHASTGAGCEPKALSGPTRSGIGQHLRCYRMNVDRLEVVKVPSRMAGRISPNYFVQILYKTFASDVFGEVDWLTFSVSY